MCPAFLVLKLPCILLYSRMHEKIKVLYPLTLLVFILFSLFVSLINWIRVRKRSFRDSFQDTNREYIISSMFFNAANFSINNKFDAQNLQEVSYNMIFTEINELNLLFSIKNRTQK